MNAPYDAAGKKRLYLLFAAIVAIVLILDQWLKVYIKTNFFLGQERVIFPNWFILHFTENNGMAFGLEIAGDYGKLLLTAFRLLAVGLIIWVLISQINHGAHIGFVASLSLVLAGALGNIIDSVAYGVIFNDINHYEGGWFYGRVVDMLYFPLIEGHYPAWFPIWAGEEFIFFRPVFNLADAAISMGVFIILIFQKKFSFSLTSNADKSAETPNVEDKTT